MSWLVQHGGNGAGELGAGETERISEKCWNWGGEEPCVIQRHWMLDCCLTSTTGFFPFHFVLLNIPVSLSTSSQSSFSLGFYPLIIITVTMALSPVIALPAFLSIIFCPQKSLQSLVSLLTCGSFLSSLIWS